MDAFEDEAVGRIVGVVRVFLCRRKVVQCDVGVVRGSRGELFTGRW